MYTYQFTQHRIIIIPCTYTAVWSTEFRGRQLPSVLIPISSVDMSQKVCHHHTLSWEGERQVIDRTPWDRQSYRVICSCSVGSQI